MKKNIYIISICLILIIGAAAFYLSRNTNNIQDTSKRFLENYYSMEFEKIYDICTPTTLKKIKDIESRTRGLIDKSQLAIPIVEIHEYYEQGDCAYCRYTLKQDKWDTNAMSEQLLLIKISEKWCVEY